MTLEDLELFKGPDVEDSDTRVARGRRDEVTVWVPGAGEDRVLVQITE
jgi:hypothetical protein